MKAITKKIILLSFLIGGIFHFNSLACDGMSTTVLSNNYLGNGEYLVTIQYCETVSNGPGVAAYGIIVSANGANIIGTTTPSFTSSNTGVTVNYNAINANTVQWGEWDNNPAVPAFLINGDPVECFTLTIKTDGPLTSVDVSGSSADIDEGGGFVFWNGRYCCLLNKSVPPVTCSSNWVAPIICPTTVGLVDLNSSSLLTGVFSGAGVNSATGMFDPTGLTFPVSVTFTVGDAGLNCATTHDLISPYTMNQIPDQLICQGAAVSLTSTATVTLPCSYTLRLEDSYGDGWNGASIDVYINGVLYGTYSGAGSLSVINLPVSTGDQITMNFSGGLFDSEITIKLLNASNTQLFSQNNPNDGWLGSGVTANCGVNSNFAYAWTPTTGLSVSNAATTIASPSDTTTYIVTATHSTTGCVLSDTVTVNVQQGLIPTFDPIGPLCLNSTPPSLPLASNNGISGTWNSSISTSTSGITNYSFTPTSGSCLSIVQLPVEILPLPAITASAAPASICQGQSTVLTGNGGTSYSWDNGLGSGNNLTTSPNATTTYNVSGTDANGCVNTAQVTVTVNPNIPIDAGADQTVCAGQQVTLTASGTPTISWSNGVTNGAAFTPASTTTYTVTGTSANGCVTTDQVTVTVNALPNINAGADQTVCVGQSVTLVGSNGQTYIWDNGVTNGTAFTVGTTTTYSVTGTDANGCVGTDQVTVTALPVPVADVSSDVTTGNEPLLVTFFNNSSNATNYTWDFGVAGSTINTNNTNNQIYNFISGGTYNVVLTASNGYCSDTAMLVINVIPLPPPSVTPPNIFTPNQDGSNDKYFITYENLASIEVVIINRWGNFMYEYNTLTGYWDGQVNGKDAEEGVYFYKFKAKGINGEELKGHGFFHLER